MKTNQKEITVTKENTMQNLNSYQLQTIIEYLYGFFQMWMDVFRKRYREIPWISGICVIGMIIYVLSPIDLLSGIPILCWVDDATVVSFAWSLAEKDIEQYAIWKNENVVQG